MSCPVSFQELRQIITRLEQLEAWQKEAESRSSSSSGGHNRGDPKARAQAAVASIQHPCFPAIPQIARNFKLVAPSGPEFSGKPFPGVEDGPGPLPRLVEDQACFVCGDQREALQRVHISYSAGFWARSSLETFTKSVNSPILSSPAKHYIVWEDL